MLIKTYNYNGEPNRVNKTLQENKEYTGVLNSNVKVTIKDDGLGFDMSESKMIRDENHGFGLTTMKERIFFYYYFRVPK